MTNYNIHAGHNPAGKVACGAVGLVNESTEARIIKDLVVQKIRQMGDTAYDCTVDNGTSKNDVLRKIVSKCNANSVGLDVSIHFNSGANDARGNGRTTGVEVYCYNISSTKARDVATKICNGLQTIGFRNRGVKYDRDLYVLANTHAQAILIEVCFVDDKDDIDVYNANKNTIATVIAESITGKKLPTTTPTGQLANGNHQGTKAIVKQTLNVRYDRIGTDGNLNPNIIGVLQKGTIIDLGYCLRGWVSIPGFNGAQGMGYVNSAYLEIVL